MNESQTILDHIGNTPLIPFRKLGREFSPRLIAKCEFLNPGASVKDRIGKHIVEQAEKEGLLQPGGLLVECTSGNTGMGLAMAASIKGYRCFFTASDKAAREKIDALRAFGAEVVICPYDVPPEDPRSYYSVARKKAEETPNAYFVNQYFNRLNPEAHYLSTGPEIWEQTEGRIGAFIAGVGTGGTISGVGKFLKEENPDIQIVGIDTYGSVLTHYHRTGEIIEGKPYITEGIGEDFIPDTVDFDVIDLFIQVEDKRAALMTRELVEAEAMWAGYSSGAAVAGALDWARDQSSEILAVVLLPDSGSRYLSKIYDDDWMKEMGFL
jgi:cystathionine beta-synthase